MVEDPNQLLCKPSENVDTLVKAFKRSVERFPNNNYLGTRDEKQEGRPYVWRSWKSCDDVSTKLSLGKFLVRNRLFAN